MTIRKAVDAMKEYLEGVTGGIILPVAVQKGDMTYTERAPAIHEMRLPDSRSYDKIAPYIIVQPCNFADKQPQGETSQSSVTMRLIFCVYNQNEEEGALMLLNLMETVRIAMLKEVFIGGIFELDRSAGLEGLIYSDDTKPYYGGELIGTLKLPEIEREVIMNGW